MVKKQKSEGDSLPLTSREFRSIIYKLPDDLKVDLRMQLLRFGITMQAVNVAFAEIFIAYAKGEKIDDPIRQIIRRAQSI